MPALRPLDLFAEVVWLGTVPDRAASLRATAAEAIDLTFAGIVGEAHSGEVRPACSRTVAQHPKGTPIRNVRQLSVVSEEELEEIARRMGIAAVDPGWIGAQVMLRGLPDFSHLPPSARLQAEAGTTLVVDMQNRPCHLPARVIDEDLPGIGGRFKAAAEGLRGVTAWVEREGPLCRGDRLRLHVPDQRAWAGAPPQEG